MKSEKTKKKSEAPNRARTARGRVAVIGLGYVGLPLALLAEEKNYQVFGVDSDATKAKLLEKRIAPYLSSGEQETFRRSSLLVSTDGGFLKQADVILMCVPTPVHENHEPDLTPVEQATKLIASTLRRGQLVIIESTINPGVCEEVIIPILESRTGLHVGADFFFAHCPERINPGDPHWNVSTIPRVVGANDPKSLSLASAFYRSILSSDVHPMRSLKEAEAVKVVENSFRDINIAFVNELAMSFDKLGIDILNVIGGASTKPFSFMPHFPSCGVGGHCIPVDPYYLIAYAAQNGFTHRFLSLARDINNKMPRYTVDLLAASLKKFHRPLSGSRIALLGLSYKKDIPDLRESPALRIKEELIERGAAVKTYDPLLPEHSTEGSLEEALTGVEGVIIATDHSEFKRLTPEMLLREGIAVLIDGKNFLPKEQFLAAGITYKGIGR
jgi:UDP-N-acetyl-D-glucosamine dehydrogenase